jgi:peptidoglycan hydrolase-like protein with peptidoglycan-binding domain
MLSDMPKASESSDSWSLGERSLAYDRESAVGGADVAELQGLLGSLGYQLPDDGIYGPTTADQVRQFQEHRRLGVDGVFGPMTFGELTHVRAVATRPVKPHYLRD